MAKNNKNNSSLNNLDKAADNNLKEAEENAAKKFDNLKEKYKSSDFKKYLGKFWVYFFLSILIMVNLTALSISLQCNKDSSFFTRILSAIFAFCFGLLYIILNYIGYRIMVLNKPCQFDKDAPFSLGPMRREGRTFLGFDKSKRPELYK